MLCSPMSKGAGVGTAPAGPFCLECLDSGYEGNLLLMFLSTSDHSFPPLDFFAIHFPMRVRWNLMKFSCLNSKKPETLGVIYFSHIL